MYTNCARSCNSCLVALPHRPTAEPVPPLTPSWKDEIPDRALVQRLGELSEAVYAATGVTDTARMPANTQPFLFRETSAGAEVLVGTFHLPEMHGGDAPLHIFVALRGSDENSDVMNNLNFALDKFGPPLTEGSLCADCRVHRGFNEASFADNLPSDIEEAVDLLLRDVYGNFEDREGAPTIYFTGHSLGGAQAHILSAYLAFQRPDLSVRMVNFGAPVLVSHDHYDHLDMVSIKQLATKVGHFYVPLGLGLHLQQWGIATERITELDWWQTAQLGASEFTLTPAEHFSGRRFDTRNKTLWGGWVVENQSQRIFFSGDSGYGPHFKEIGRRFGEIDIAFLDTGQYNRPQKISNARPVYQSGTLRNRVQVENPLSTRPVYKSGTLRNRVKSRFAKRDELL